MHAGGIATRTMAVVHGYDFAASGCDQELDNSAAEMSIKFDIEATAIIGQGQAWDAPVIALNRVVWCDEGMCYETRRGTHAR